NVECDLVCLTDYLVRLEKMSNRLVRISRLDISRSEKRRRGGRKGDLGVAMTLSTVVKSKNEPGSGGPGAAEGGKNEKK
ncbi:MAG: hypothetical protein ACYTHM_23415, partial [Planctomycetota bacterium]